VTAVPGWHVPLESQHPWGQVCKPQGIAAPLLLLDADDPLEELDPLEEVDPLELPEAPGPESSPPELLPLPLEALPPLLLDPVPPDESSPPLEPLEPPPLEEEPAEASSPVVPSEEPLVASAGDWKPPASAGAA
jgi:hypothetical protein